MQTIGICVFGAIGDALLSSSIIGDLKRRYPGARVIMVVTESNGGIIPLLPLSDGSLVLPIYAPRQAFGLMRRQQFDLLIDANQWLRISAVYCALAGAKYTVGFRTVGQYRHYAFDLTAEHSATHHELENYRRLLTAIGIAGTSSARIDPPRADAVVSRLTRSPYIVLHPWAGGGRAELKEWPSGYWIEIGKVMSARGFALVVTGSSGDVSKARDLVEAANESGVPMILLAGRLNLGQTAALLQHASLVVSVNTGIMHMAAALDVSLVVLHGPTNPDRWGPLSDKAVSVVPGPVPAGVPVGYLNLGFEFPKDVPDCMGFIAVEHVLAAIDTALAKRGESVDRPRPGVLWDGPRALSGSVG